MNVATVAFPPGRRPDASRRNARPGLAATDDGKVRAECGERLCRRQPNAIGRTRDQDLLVVHGTAIQGYGPRAKCLQQHVRWSRRISLRDGDTIARLCGNRGLHRFVPTQQVRRGCQGAIVATMDWLYPLSGFVVGAIVGLTGTCGGSLMTPLLILLFGVHPLTAVGLALRRRDENGWHRDPLQEG